MNATLAAEQGFVQDLWQKVEAKLAVTADRLRDSMPYTAQDGLYVDCQTIEPSWWTNTFWTGTLWHLYRETGADKYRRYAQSIEAKLDRVLLDYDELHHDVGFMWLLSAVMNHEITGDQAARKRAMLAASVLSSRFNLAGGFIRAWNGDHRGWAIIDCMMNIPLLYWAAEKAQDDRFKHIALAHAEKSLAHFVRADGSVNHIVIFDEKTGDFLEAPRGQGYESGSAWSRGQSWALYGFAQSYGWTQKPEHLAAAKKIAHYVLANLPSTCFVPPCDYRQPSDSHLPDSSAGAITACGLIEIAKFVPTKEQDLYLKGALSILKALDANCADWDHSTDPLLLHGTSAFHASPGSRWDVFDGALIYGDFYFVEALCHLKALLKGAAE